MNSQIEGVPLDEPYREQYPPPKIIDSKKIFERLKTRVKFWKQEDPDNENYNTLDRRQHELWKLIRDSPSKNSNGNPEQLNKNSNVIKPDNVAESANTFLTDPDKDGIDEFAHISPIKITALDQSPLFDVQSPLKEASGSSPVLVERLTDKFQFKKVGLKRIQERLNKIAEAKENVAKNYNKLATEITSWCSLCLERDSELDLLNDLQQVLATDKKAEQTLTKLFILINDKLEYVAKREENMLQERKDVNSLAKKYDVLRVKKGDQNMETQYLKENLQRKRSSLSQLTEQYYDALGKILREEFTRACFTIYDMGSDLKDVTRDFSLQSIDVLKTHHNTEYIDQFLEDVRKVRADKQWNRLTYKERNDPNKLAEIVGNLYNGQDSLLRFASNKVPIKFSPLPLHGNVTDNSMDGINSKPSGELDLSMSQYGTDKYNDITTNKYMLKKPILTDIRPLSHPFTTLQNLRAPASSRDTRYNGKMNVTGSMDANLVNSFPHPPSNLNMSFTRPRTESNVPRHQNIPENTSSESLDGNDKDVVMKFGHDLNNSFIEADQLLATNAWD